MIKSKYIYIDTMPRRYVIFVLLSLLNQTDDLILSYSDIFYSKDIFQD